MHQGVPWERGMAVGVVSCSKCVVLQVKKGLEKLFRRVEREVSEEVLEVVWGDMQGCFMQQVARFNQLIQQCYSGRSLLIYLM